MFYRIFRAKTCSSLKWQMTAFDGNMQIHTYKNPSLLSCIPALTEKWVHGFNTILLIDPKTSPHIFFTSHNLQSTMSAGKKSQ